MEKRYIEISNIIPAFSLSCTDIVLNKHTGVYGKLPSCASILQAEHEGYLFIHVDFTLRCDWSTDMLWRTHVTMNEYIVDYIIRELNIKKTIPMRTRA